ncbi:MAG: hypothetical protein ACLGI2_12040 [Acidimicrobiia bacterium]
MAGGGTSRSHVAPPSGEPRRAPPGAASATDRPSRAATRWPVSTFSPNQSVHRSNATPGAASSGRR